MGIEPTEAPAPDENAVFVEPSKGRYADMDKPVCPKVQSLIDSERYKTATPGGFVELEFGNGSQVPARDAG